jgi:hypothetical protein
MLAMRVARLARSVDPGTARDAAEIALQAPGLEDAERGALEAIVAAGGAQPGERGIPLGSRAADEGMPSPEEQLDHGAVGLSEISAEPEALAPASAAVSAPSRALEFDPEAMDLSEVSGEASQAPDLTDASDAFQEPAASNPAADRFEFFETEDGDLSEKEEPLPEVRRTLRVFESVPRKLDEEALWLEVEGKGRTRLPLSRVEAVAAAGVHGMSRKAVILIDLALDWTAGAEKPLSVLRLRSDRYDPRGLVGIQDSPLKAISQLASALITRARAIPLPDAGSARGEPFRVFRDLALYEEQVLGAERPPVEDVF